MKFAREITEPALAPRAEIADVTLAEWAAMDEAEWKRRTAGTALRRTKWVGFRRNAAAVIAQHSRPDGAVEIPKVADHERTMSTLPPPADHQLPGSPRRHRRVRGDARGSSGGG